MTDSSIPEIPSARELQYKAARDLHGDGRACAEIVVTGVPQKEISMLALSAIEAHNRPPYIFNRSGNRVWVIRDEDGNPQIKILDENAIRYILERACQFFVYKKVVENKKTDFIKEPIAPPKNTVSDLQGAPSWPLPPLEGVVECPYMLEDGSLVLEGGYHPESKLFYMKKREDSISVPETVTREDIISAKQVLDDMFTDFMFVDAASRTNNIATLLTAVLRPMIPGITPLIMYDKPIMGSGASLLSKIIILAALGRIPSMIPAPNNDEEMEKRIMAILFSGMKVAVFDNCEGKIYFKSLASVLTSEIVSQRLFGKNTVMIHAKNSVLWIINGNNIQLGGDLPRRVIPIRIDPQTSRPWQRDNFVHPDILKYVEEKRPAILQAVLTLARGWDQADRPKPGQDIPKVGSYESWRDIIGGILSFAEYESFLGNLEVMYQESDVETPQWEAFLNVWYSLWGSDRKKVREVVERMEKELNSSCEEYRSELKFSDVIPDFIVGDGKKKDLGKIIGKALLKIRDREWSNGLKVIRASEEKNTVLWRVLKKSDDLSLGGFVGFGGFASSQTRKQKVLSVQYGKITETNPPNHPNPPTKIPTTIQQAEELLLNVNGVKSKLSKEQQEAVRNLWKEKK